MLLWVVGTSRGLAALRQFMPELQTPGQLQLLPWVAACTESNSAALDVRTPALDSKRGWVRRYPLFTMAPEGTTKHSGYLLQFSTGAFVGGQPVIPVLLKYRCR